LLNERCNAFKSDEQEVPGWRDREQHLSHPPPIRQRLRACFGGTPHQNPRALGNLECALWAANVGGELTEVIRWHPRQGTKRVVTAQAAMHAFIVTNRALSE
jgi:hypothetical protein